MKTLAALALLGLAYTYEDDEFIVRPIHIKPHKPLEKQTKVEAHDHENFIRPPTRPSPFPDPRIPSPTFPHPKVPVFYEDDELFLPKASLLASANLPHSERVIAFDEELFQTLPLRKRLPFPDPRVPSPTFPHPNVPVFYDDELSLLRTTALASNLPRSERVIAFDEEELFQTLPFRKPLPFPDPRIPSPTFPHPEISLLFDEEELFMPNGANHRPVKKVKELVKNTIQEDDFDQNELIRFKTESLISDSLRAKSHVSKDDIEDENLVSLKNLINDGLHLYKDVKEKNLENVIKDGVQTVKDLKKKDKFLGH